MDLKQPALPDEEGFFPYKKSSASEGETACVEVAVGSKGAKLRDTKNRAGGALQVGREGYVAFLRKTGAA